MRKFLLNLVLSLTLAFCFFSGFVALCVAGFTWGPVIESKVFPVVGKLHMLNVREGTAPNTTDIEAGFNKIRPCEYIGLSWFHKQMRPDGGFEKIPVVLNRRPGDVTSPNRPLGWQTAGPWTVFVAKTELPNTFAILYHKCHIFWTTQTEFWP